SADNAISYDFLVPVGYTGHTASVEVDWFSDNAACDNNGSGTTDDVCFSWDGGSIGAGSQLVTSPTLGGPPNGVTATCTGNGVLLRSTKTGYVHGMTDGQYGMFTMSRVTSDSANSGIGCTSGDHYAQPAKVVRILICPE